MNYPYNNDEPRDPDKKWYDGLATIFWLGLSGSTVVYFLYKVYIFLPVALLSLRNLAH
jgi:hypothetical protein